MLAKAQKALPHGAQGETAVRAEVGRFHSLILSRFEAAIEGAPSKAKAIIEDAQPYGIDTPFFHPLGLISRLDNADKHRSLAAIMHGVREAKVSVHIGGEDYTRQVKQPDPGLREHGTELTKLSFATWRGRLPKASEVKVQVRGTVEVTASVGSPEEAREATGTVGGFMLVEMLDYCLASVIEVLTILVPYVRRALGAVSLGPRSQPAPREEHRITLRGAG